MCGLVGVIIKGRNGFNYKQLEVFETLLFLDTLRGEDSTGVFAVNNIGNVGIAKDAVTGENFLKTDAWKEYRSQLFKDGWAVVGHNRKATRGSISAENAHPFWIEDKLVLVHNGSFNGSHAHLKNVEVDSHAIAHTLAEHGANDVQGALQKVNAAYALIWYDIENKAMNFIRNDQRPLTWCETSDAWYYASDYKMLEFALHRAGEKILEKIWEFPEHNHHKWILKDDKSSAVQSVLIDAKYKYTGTYDYKQYQNRPPHSRHAFAGAYEMDGMGCSTQGWWDNQDDFNAAIRELADEQKQVETKVTTKVEAVAGSVDLTVMPWMPRITCKQFQELRLNYVDGNKVRVIVDDYIDDDNKQPQVMVSGKTLDAHNIPVIFKLNRETLGILTDPTDAHNVENTVFEITICGASWRNIDKVKHRNIDDAEGLMILRGSHPVLNFTSSGVGHA